VKLISAASVKSNFHLFVELYVPLSLPKQLATGQMDPVSIPELDYLEVHFNIILPPTLRSSRWILPANFINQNYVSFLYSCCFSTPPLISSSFTDLRSSKLSDEEYIRVL
jgi:hypothetical protein